MKLLRYLIALALFTTSSAQAQTKPRSIPPVPPKPPAPITKVASPNPVIEMPFESFKNDPLNTRIYTLKNGFTVYLTVNKDAPRIQTYIAVKAGSKNDPSDATGLAHYLEHMLFKGTDKFGTTNYELEKPLLDKIYSLFEDYRATTDTTKRAKIYKLIDSVSGEAAKIGIANEYDKMVAAIGAKGTNAHTSFEETVYKSDIPSNQLDNFLKLEAERFRNPVMRIFHTELEAVYEEKNRSLDSDGSKLWEATLSGLFKKHTYGTQTTIGTVEHLKNPSLKRINEFMQRYYQPSNMALCMSGDFDVNEAIKLIDKHFGNLPDNKFAERRPLIIEDEITTPVVKEVFGPDAESVLLAYRCGGQGTADADMLTLISKILYNGKAGLIDLDLVQAQRLSDAGVECMILNEYGAFILNATAKENQKLEDAKDLLLAEIEKLKKGEFPEWLLKAVLNEMKLNQTIGFESNENRATYLYENFISNMPYTYKIGTMERLAQISKQNIVDFAKKFFANNYVVVYKRNGENKNVQKVTKPKITPVETNANLQSNFLKEIVNSKVKEIRPEFINYKEKIREFVVNSNVPVWYVKNNNNNLFTLNYVFNFGKASNKKLELALNYLPMLGITKQSAADVSEAFYKIGCSYETKVNEDFTTLTLTGLTENFNEGVKLFEQFLNDCQPNKEAFGNLIDKELKDREDAKLSKNIILQQALVNYAYYGEKSPFSNVLSKEELQNLAETDLIDIIKTLKSYKHSLWYFGNEESDILINKLNELHQTQKTLRELPASVLAPQLPTTENKIYACNYTMKQAEVIMLSKQNMFDKKELPTIRLFQEYFGSGMQSIVFQTMRESKALAYSVYSRYVVPTVKERSFFTLSYIGTQADKLPEALEGMHFLFDSLPKIPANFEGAKTSLLQKIKSERIKPADYAMSYYNAQRLGVDYDLRKDVFEALPALTYANIQAFHKQHFQRKKYTTILVGNKDNINPSSLLKYGKVEWLDLKTVFGY